MGEEELRAEWLKCHHSSAYFIHNYAYLYDAVQARWLPFHLWPAQYDTLRLLGENRLCVILKARQLGLTWLCLGHILWKMLFHPSQTVLLFSRREDEAIYLLRKRLKVMHSHLPDWMRETKFITDSQHEWHLDNGSIAYAFPTTAGDSYTASIALVDEADLIPDLASLMNAVKPTIDAGGQMVLLSRANKDEPTSPFKSYYRAAKKGENEWAHIFLPWNSRPDRTQEWYEAQKNDIVSRTGSIDDLWQQYPATDSEALAPRTMTKRIPPQWLEANFVEIKPLDKPRGVPAIPQFKVYREPVKEARYVIGADPAEGNPSSDDSSIEVLDVITGEEVATLSNKVEPTVFADYIAQVAAYYNEAVVMVERNNHGHTVIAWLTDNTTVDLLRGADGSMGWQTTGKSKAEAYTTAAECFRDRLSTIHSFETFMQLSSIDGATLKAPKGQLDDKAMAFVLALKALHMPKHMTVAYDYTEETIGRRERDLWTSSHYHTRR